MNIDTLSLILRSAMVGDAEAQALAALDECPCLRSLTLDLCSNCLGPAGVQALSALQLRCAAKQCTVHLKIDTLEGDGVADPDEERPLLGSASTIP